MAARKISEINASSTADIAFLLLIFFLVTTTMDVDSGIPRRLPPPVDKNADIPKVPKRNIFVVLINSADQILVNGKPGNLRMLRKEAKEFLTPYYSGNPVSPDVDGHPEVSEIDVEGIGKVWKSKGIVSMQNDRGTSYKTYIHVQNELAGAVSELRDEMSNQYFGMDFSILLDKFPDKAKSIQKAVPMSISEAEPVSLGE